MEQLLKPITIKLEPRRCSVCGNITVTDMRGFSDNGSPISQAVCYPCLVECNLAAPPHCKECNYKLMFVEEERFWICPYHGRQEVNEFPDGKHFHYVKPKEIADEQD